jgi:predicted nucleic acid-binding Zn ribbon protein
MDDADAADLTINQALAAAMRRRHATLPAVGTCYSCAEPVDDGRRFCDRECLEDFERAERARRMNGRME